MNMSDAKQEFIDEVMRLARNMALSANPDVNQLNALRTCMQERIGEPVAYSTTESNGMLSDVLTVEAKADFDADDIAAYTIPLYSLDGGRKGE
jgi:hypothetical protein